MKRLTPPMNPYSTDTNTPGLKGEDSQVFMIQMGLGVDGRVLEAWPNNRSKIGSDHVR